MNKDFHMFCNIYWSFYSLPYKEINSLIFAFQAHLQKFCLCEIWFSSMETNLWKLNWNEIFVEKSNLVKINLLKVYVQFS